jgi:hypothetical protein
MTTNNTETKVPNPYNANKDWHNDIDEQNTQNANYAFVPESRKRKKKEEPKVEPVTQEPTEGTDEFVKAKRYYDLKKYHDQTVTSLRSEISELRELVKGKAPDAPVTETKPVDQTPPVVATPKVTSEAPVVDEKELRAKKAEAKVAILEAHPDFNKLVQGTDFHEWADDQTDEVKEWIYDNPFDAEKAIEALNLYKAFVKEKEESRNKKQDSTSQVGADTIVSTRTVDVATTNGKKAWKPEDIKRMSVSDWEKHREEILDSLRGTK